MNLEDFFKLTTLPVEPKPITKDAYNYFLIADYYLIAEFALLQSKNSSTLKPIMSIGFHERDGSNYLMFSENAEKIPGHPSPLALNPQFKEIKDICSYILIRKNKP